MISPAKLPAMTLSTPLVLLCLDSTLQVLSQMGIEVAMHRGDDMEKRTWSTAWALCALNHRDKLAHVDEVSKRATLDADLSAGGRRGETGRNTFPTELNCANITSKSKGSAAWAVERQSLRRLQRTRAGAQSSVDGHGGRSIIHRDSRPWCCELCVDLCGASRRRGELGGFAFAVHQMHLSPFLFFQ